MVAAHAGDATALDDAAARGATEYTASLAVRAAYYALEQHFPASAFWSRRAAAVGDGRRSDHGE